MPIQQQQSWPVADALRCPECGEAYEAPSRFCGRDGARLRAEMPSSVRLACDAYAPTLPSTALAQALGRAATPIDSLAPPVTRTEALFAGRYVKLRALGGGSQGEVWLVHDIQTGRLLALKCFRPEMDVARCRAEIEAATRIDDCSHVVKLYELHCDPETQAPFVTMEYLEGETLEDRLAHGPELSLSEAVAVLQQVSRGLSAMHDKQLVHRDIKPANIMLLPANPGYHVKLLDLGIAKSLSPASAGIPPVTLPGWVLGTRDYAAPEQLRGGRVTAAFDVYALGVVAHELCEGRLPDEPAMRKPRLPIALRELIAQMLHKDPARRPRSMRAVEEALAQIEASLQRRDRAPTLARPQPRSAPAQAREIRIRVPKRAAFPRFVVAAAGLAVAVYCLFSPMLQAADAEARATHRARIVTVTQEAPAPCKPGSAAAC